MRQSSSTGARQARKSSVFPSLDIATANDFAALLSMERPDKAAGFQKRGNGSAIVCAQRAMSAWRQLLDPEFIPPVGTTEDERWRSRERAMEVAALHYNAAARHLIETTDSIPPGLSIPSIVALRPDITMVPRLIICRLFALDYLLCLTYAALLRSTKDLLPEAFCVTWEWKLHDSVEASYKLIADNRESPFAHVASVLHLELLELITHEYSQVGKKVRSMPPFVNKWVDELGLLASRTPAVIAKYGVRQTDKVFEQALALLLQSFGFMVASTRIGQRTVDLVCIASQRDGSYTFLVEAKSSNSAYSFPPRDQRALLEYVRESKRLLQAVPLAFAIVIAPSFRDSVGRRTEAVQAEAGLPIRACPVHVLLRLRHQVPGPLPIEEFRRLTLRAGVTLGDDFTAALVQANEAMTLPHTTWVREMLALSGTASSPGARGATLDG